MSSSFAARLERLRAERWVGRAGELTRFAAFAAGHDEPRVVFVHGPGGIGKTSLLERFAALARDAGRRVVSVDARNVGASVEGFVAAVSDALGEGEGSDPAAALAKVGPAALLVDTFEAVRALEPWLRSTFLPGLPQSVLVVLAGRHPPSVTWVADPGWSEVLDAMPLSTLGLDESEELLRRRGVDDSVTATLARVCHGHPLALALAAEVRHEGTPSSDALPVDVVRALLGTFVGEVGNPRHREALQICALARVTDEALLRHGLNVDDAAEAYEWLRGRPFMQDSPEGLFPHDLAREVLAADLLARDAERFGRTAQHLREYFIDRLEGRSVDARRRAFYDLMYIGRHSPQIGKFLTFDEPSSYATAARVDDVPAIVDFFARHEGEASARWVSWWLPRCLESVTVFRREDGGLAGALALLELAPEGRARDGEDPAVAAMWRHVDRHAPLRGHERILYARFWGAEAAFHGISPTQDLIQAQIASTWVTCAHLAWTFVATIRPEIWTAQFQALEMPVSDTAAFELDGVPRTVYARDWRSARARDWLRLRGQATPQRAVAGLPLEVFDEAVREALKEFSRPDKLAATPLLQCAALRGAEEPVAALRAWLGAAAADLGQHPRDHKLFRAVEVTYLKGAPTQQAAAERLDLPFGTYRRHLVGGVARLVEILWAKEQAARRE